ncbi:hypothetical protein DFP72DRAFT_635455 [Ephemerocybe angulata]|uniref:Uncharacterized protein n=1 Tax=Ephemerocybe angulata TaxID=980116 RepID=A0A8H6HG09_9AGAR|nr:hypothetical protein DFP72DRAFT_635455 [Tulosesus angulatus]
MPTSVDQKQDRIARWIDQTTMSSSGVTDSFPTLPHRRRQPHPPSRPYEPLEAGPPPKRSPSRLRKLRNPERESAGSRSAPTTTTTRSSEDSGAGTFSTAYPAIVMLVACFLFAAVLPSLLILVVFAVFLTVAPAYDSIQTAQFLPLHREASVISLNTDEDIEERAMRVASSPERNQPPGYRRRQTA